MRVLLLGANYYGTLAAARVYGKRGIAVTVADDTTRPRARYSRYVTDTVVHPPLSDVGALIDWLVAWGQAHPGTLLYAPNDHLAWIFAAHRDRLSAVFAMHVPSEQAIITLLDKQRLHEACAHPEVGIDVPDTRTLGPAGADDAAAATLPYPVLLKPRTQVLLESGIKGFVVENHEALAGGLAKFASLIRFNRALTDLYADVAIPMVQQYLSAAETSIVSVSGYVSEDGEVVARAALKVLQRPRKVGIGLCFEGRSAEPGLVRKIAALCRRVGYFGAFEAEFVADGDRRLLIDFNPRFYSQMAFDIARGMSLPMMVWHAARGEQWELAQEMQLARLWMPTGHEVYCHRTMLELVLTLQGLSGRMSKSDVRYWRNWYAQHRDEATDAVRDVDDPRPAMADTAAWLKSFAAHPRSFVMSFVLNRS
jgi:predicted ATP-grasp superfamily ATP-dependent carboligase